MKKKTNTTGFATLHERLRQLPTSLLFATAGMLVIVSIVLSAANFTNTQSAESDRVFTSAAPGYAPPSKYGYEDGGDHRTGAAGVADTLAERGSIISPSPIPPVGDGGTVPGREQQLVRRGELDLEVNSVEQSAERVRAVADFLEGRVERMNIFETTGERKSGFVVVRVPSERFDEAMHLLKKDAINVKRETSNATDVTKRVVDMEARLRNLRAEEAQYVEIMERAGEIKDVLQVVSQLSRVRDQIERLEAQLATVLHSVELSTITVNLSSSPTINVVDRSWDPILAYKQGAKNLINDLQDFYDGAVLLFFKIPALLIWAAIFWLIFIAMYRLARFMRRRM